MSPIRLRLVAGMAALCASALPLAAQDAIFRSVTAPSGRTTRLAVVPNLDKQCKPGQLGTLKVVTAPKNGSLIMRTGKVRTPGTYRCPNLDATIQALFYRPHDRYAGADEIVLETKLPDGNPQTVTVRITVTPRSATPEKKDFLDL